MKKIRILATGFYNRGEKRVSLHKAGEIHEVKRETGRACAREETRNSFVISPGVYIEKENAEVIELPE